MDQIQGCIDYWERTLLNNKHLLDPSVIVLIEVTIKLLEELESIKRGTK